MYYFFHFWNHNSLTIKLFVQHSHILHLIRYESVRLPLFYRLNAHVYSLCSNRIAWYSTATLDGVHDSSGAKRTMWMYIFDFTLSSTFLAELREFAMPRCNKLQIYKCQSSFAGFLWVMEKEREKKPQIAKRNNETNAPWNECASAARLANLCVWLFYDNF